MNINTDVKFDLKKKEKRKVVLIVNYRILLIQELRQVQLHYYFPSKLIFSYKELIFLLYSHLSAIPKVAKVST